MMKLNVSESENGQEQSFCFTATADEIDAVPNNCSIEGDVTIKGTILFTGRVYRLEGIVKCHRSFVCDRCLGEFAEDAEYPFSEEFRRRGEEDADDSSVTFFEDSFIDITLLVRDTILAAQPISNLCRPDCLGLCLKCGADLNKGDCGCDRRVVDPRLAALQDLIKK